MLSIAAALSPLSFVGGLTPLVQVKPAVTRVGNLPYFYVLVLRFTFSIQGRCGLEHAFLGGLRPEYRSSLTSRQLVPYEFYGSCS